MVVKGLGRIGGEKCSCFLPHPRPLSIEKMVRGEAIIL